MKPRKFSKISTRKRHFFHYFRAGMIRIRGRDTVKHPVEQRNETKTFSSERNKRGPLIIRSEEKRGELDLRELKLEMKSSNKRKDGRDGIIKDKESNKASFPSVNIYIQYIWI